MKTIFSINLLFETNFPEEEIENAVNSPNPACAFYNLLRNNNLFSTIEALDKEFELGVNGVYNGFTIQPDNTVKWASDNFDEIIWEG